MNILERDVEDLARTVKCPICGRPPEAMGIDWMNGNELSQAIPPRYTVLVGAQLISHLSERTPA